MIIYVHNLSYEFQFMRKHFLWDKVFLLDDRKVVQAITGGFEFKCSYILSGLSLDNVGKTLKRKIPKLIGELDYSKIRTPKTSMTKGELNYCFNDVKIVCQYIREKMEKEEIFNIPLTKTGIVRRDVKNACLKTKSINDKKYGELMRSLYLLPEEYQLAKRAFKGGFTHANIFSVNIILKNIASFDFASSYPYTCLSEFFPMSHGIQIDINNEDDFYNYNNKYLMIFDIEMTNVVSTFLYEDIISSSKCYIIKNGVLNNGRVQQCDYLKMSITNVDFEYLKKFYSWEKTKISNCFIYKRGYLPKPIILKIIEYFQYKTTLKNVPLQEDFYLFNKSNLNSIYGMMVTDIVNDEIIYDNETQNFTKVNKSLEVSLAKYNHSKSRFLFYLWGIFITSYAQRNLFTGIYECKEDYHYSDTDSLKISNFEKHQKYFIEYNKQTEIKLKKMCNYYDIDYEQLCPKDFKGNIQHLGMWDRECDCLYFKTLGAKRYVKIYNDYSVHFVISGVKSSSVAKYLGGKYVTYNEETKQYYIQEDKCEWLLNKFKHGMKIPSNKTEKNTHTYLDDEMEGDIIDYQGNHYHYKELSAIHIEGASFEMTLAKEFQEMLERISKLKVR